MPKTKKRGLVVKEINSEKQKLVKKSASKKTTNKRQNTELEKVLIENFVSLQKIMTNLSVKFDNLSSQISKLLDLFEISAKALAEKNFNESKEDRDDKKVIEKIDNVLEQNKIIARGLSILHEQEPRHNMNPTQPQQRPPQQRREMGH